LNALALVALLSSARAHDPGASPSSVRWRDEGATLSVTMSAQVGDALRRVGLTPGEGLPAMIQLDGCAPGPLAARPAAAGRLRYRWEVACPSPPERLDASGLLAALPGHVHLARLEGAAGAAREVVLTVDAPDAPLAAASRAPPAALFAAGARHLLSGWDHVVFVLTLTLLPTRLAALAWAVSGFTLGHAAALGLVAGGWMLPDPAGVEALIGWSIAALAAETVWLEQGRAGAIVPALVALAPLAAALGPGGPTPLAAAGAALFAAAHFASLRRAARPARARLRVCALFGLIHGLGLAGALEGLGGGLARAVVGFNLGVEAAGLALLIAAWPAARWLHRRPAHIAPAAAAAMACGAWALVARAAG